MGKNKDVAVAFLRSVTSGQIRDAYKTYVSDDFRHHNSYFRGDAESLMRGMEENEAQFPGKELEVKHALEDGEFVAVHSRLQLEPGKVVAVVHLMRFSDGLIVEMWDVGQPLPAESQNENGPF